MSDFKISVAGQALENYQLRQVRSDKSLLEVEQHLKDNPDGFDTIGIKIEDQDYLIIGKGLKAHAGDPVTVEGKASGSVAFVENEENSFGEGFKAGLKTKMMGLEYSVAGAPFLIGEGLIKGTKAAIRSGQAHEKEIEKVTEGPPLTRKMFEDAAEAISNMFGGGD
ncbi:MAG: hypothetical protein IV090_15840 [Candidatus Sericytochromatia bacterium]|nr:hypothetical protein [Candidatus Sericytochromatia bacterium]